MALTMELARKWLDRWDLQQEHYMPDREERFDVVISIVEQVVQRRDPLVVDLGTGPGSLAHRLVDRMPGAQVVGVDADPLLLGLGSAARTDGRIRSVLADLREPGWFDALALTRAPDAYVSSTALHWMNRTPLCALLHRCGATIAKGGVFVDADHLYEGDGGRTLDTVARALTARSIGQRPCRHNENWEQWWEAVAAAPELAELARCRDGGFAHVVDDRPTVHDYLDYLRSGGFREAGILWQKGDDRVIAGIA
ncbi:class I SAM-dependent methyltransferase [Mycolicibacterium nivoides]|uniref:class I SAM-dependent methyltransferase n=1 Tax=Mycolicibacterium nivoides TaxID=2487344 RepID=UPI003C30CD1D